MVYTKREGFTLIEILIAIFIVGILAGGAIYYMAGYLEQARMTRVNSDLKVISQAIEMYNNGIGQYPSRLKDLVKRPSDESIAKKWLRTGYLKGKKVPLDPWNSPYKYKMPGEEGHPYELYSYGPEKKGASRSKWISVWDD